MSRKGAVALLAVPVAALLSSVWLPFVNTDRLWFGLPALFVWTSVWVLAITPFLALVNRTHRGADEEDGPC